jgi:hypothetical protein
MEGTSTVKRQANQFMTMSSSLSSHPVIRGPATEALERSSFKRKRTIEPVNLVEQFASAAAASSAAIPFQLDALFQHLQDANDEQAFPSIDWDFNEDSDKVDSTNPLVQGSNKRRSSDIVRSKTTFRSPFGMDAVSPQPQESESETVRAASLLKNLTLPCSSSTTSSSSRPLSASHRSCGALSPNLSRSSAGLKRTRSVYYGGSKTLVRSKTFMSPLFSLDTTATTTDATTMARKHPLNEPSSLELTNQAATMAMSKLLSSSSSSISRLLAPSSSSSSSSRLDHNLLLLQQSVSQPQLLLLQGKQHHNHHIGAAANAVAAQNVLSSTQRLCA